jgi:DNA-directed RNA polymerase II subunit RPB2
MIEYIQMENISWKLIDKYFSDNPNNLVTHHLESYNDFFKSGITKIFNENNPIRFIEKEDNSKKEERNECLLYLGGKNGDKIYHGTPVIYDDSHTHYMYPNDARLRNMTYGATIHYDVEVDFKYFADGKETTHNITFHKIFLGKFPVMLQSNLCVLQSLSREVRFNMGECRNDYGGYFIIDGKEKVIISQETSSANNMLYVRKGSKGDIYSYSAEIRSVSEDTSKQIRKTSVKLLDATTVYSNKNIVVFIPNVKKPIPLFILMRALGVVSDKEIIEYCVLDIDKHKDLMDLFVPSIHDANKIFNQDTALNFIKTFTKHGTVTGVMEILSDYFLAHVGEINFREKAHFIGLMVMKLINVYMGYEQPTDRDSFMYKRVELSGNLLNGLFREYYLQQKKEIAQKIDKEYYFHKAKYKESAQENQDEDKYKGHQFIKLIESNLTTFFKDRTVESGVRKAFKGNWGASIGTKKIGVVQDLNRLSWNSFISQLRKINLPLASTAKVVGPRHLHASQWGYIDPVDTPDGGNIGLHKHLSIMTRITSGFSAKPLLFWLRNNTNIKLLCESTCKEMANMSKILVNGRWIGVIDTPIELLQLLKLYRRNGIIPLYTSISFDYKSKEVIIFTDSGRLIRPLFYVDEMGKSTDKADLVKKLETNSYSWIDIVSGTKTKSLSFDPYKNAIYEVTDLFPHLSKRDSGAIKELHASKSIVEFIDTSEENNALIATDLMSENESSQTTHIEIDPSLIFGVMGNSIVYPEFNQFPRDVFSCGQSKQAVSMYHSNYQNRFDKMGVVLQYGQTPLIKSRYLEYINHEEHPYGINTIVAIMCYTGYNVEDAILVNQGSIDRGLFRTTYYTMYEDSEQNDIQLGEPTKKFGDINNHNVLKKKSGCDYNYLDEHGIIKEETKLTDEVILIGKMSFVSNDMILDDSIKPKKGQLGTVDKTFITEGVEGSNIAKVRIREERIPAIGDKMSSRCGQKGTIGLIVPEENMPFTEDGVRPDLIINPHAIPSRMTIGQILESLLGKLCTNVGGFGDCTAFQTKGSNHETYKKTLVDSGFHASGNEILYNGMTGEQIISDIYIGPTYYMRLKHMVKDKINHRSGGPRNNLTRQTVQGRANDGGLRIGEMERDGILAHGMSQFLYDSFMQRGDRYYMAICNISGCIAIYNKSRNLFLSPSADGPITFHTNVDGSQNIEIISKYGRSFSIVEIPYSFKLLMQELQVMNIQLRIVTDENVSHIMNLKHSNNLQKLLQSKETDLHKVIDEYKRTMQKLMKNDTRELPIIPSEPPEFPDVLSANNMKISSSDESASFVPSSGTLPFDINSQSKSDSDTQPAFNIVDHLSSDEKMYYYTNLPAESLSRVVKLPPKEQISLIKSYYSSSKGNQNSSEINLKTIGEFTYTDPNTQTNIKDNNSIPTTTHINAPNSTFVLASNQSSADSTSDYDKYAEPWDKDIAYDYSYLNAPNNSTPSANTSSKSNIGAILEFDEETSTTEANVNNETQSTSENNNSNSTDTDVKKITFG